MKLELRRQDFLKAWQIAENFTDRKSGKESTSGILLTAFDDGRVTLVATDLKTSVRCKAEGVNVIESGVAVVPAAILGSMLKKLASDNLFLEINSERGFLAAGKSKTRFTIISAETFPKIPESSNAEEIFEFNATDLARLIAEGSSAASKPDDFPKYLGTCLVRTGADTLNVVATDGKRLSISKSECKSIKKETDLLLPSQAFKELGKTLTANYPEKSVKILADESTVWFNLEDIEFSIRSIDASFPSYDRILNDKVQTAIKIKTEDLIPALERIDIIARTTPAHIMSMTFCGNGNPEIKITSRAPEYGTASETVTAPSVEGEYLQVGFNVGYFMEGLKILGSGEIIIEFSGEEGQTRMLRNGGNGNFLYMLMPARLSQQDKIADLEMDEFENEIDFEENEISEPAAENNENDNNTQE